MLLLGYLLGFALISLLLKNKGKRTRALLLVSYNYLFAMALLIRSKLTGVPPSTENVLKALIMSVYNTPPTMTFRGDIKSAANIQEMLIYCCISIYTLRAAVLLFFQKTWIFIRMSLRMLFRRDIYVVWGEETDAELLLKDLHKSVRHAAAVYIPFQEPKNLPGLPALCSDKTFFQHTKSRKTYHVVLLPDRKGGNLDRLQWLHQIEDRKGSYHVTAMMKDDTVRLTQLQFPGLDAYIVSHEALLLQQFLQENNQVKLLQSRTAGTCTDAVWTPDRPLSLCVVGLSDVSRAFLLSVYENTSFETAQNRPGLQALVLVRQNAEAERFAADYPACGRDGSISFSVQSAPDLAVLDNLSQGAQYDEILLSTGNTELNIAACQRLLRFFRGKGMTEDELPRIIVVVHADEDGSVSLVEHEKQVVLLHADKGLLTYEALIRRSMDKQAQEQHAAYLRHSGKQLIWSDLDVFTQDSNRAVVQDIANKHALCADFGKLSPEERESCLWRLARYEHNRWVAFHAAHGWDLLAADALTPSETASYTLKRPTQKRHACMCDWDGLDALPQQEPDRLKRYDYANASAAFSDQKAADA